MISICPHCGEELPQNATMWQANAALRDQIEQLEEERDKLRAELEQVFDDYQSIGKELVKESARCERMERALNEILNLHDNRMWTSEHNNAYGRARKLLEESE